MNLDMSVLLNLMLLALADCTLSSSKLEEAVNYKEVCFNSTFLCSDEDGDFCPPGLFCVDGRCKCGAYPTNRIICNGTSISAKRGTCVTYSDENNMTYAGDCPFLLNSSGDALLFFTSEKFFGAQ